MLWLKWNCWEIVWWGSVDGKWQNFLEMIERMFKEDFFLFKEICIIVIHVSNFFRFYSGFVTWKEFL